MFGNASKTNNGKLLVAIAIIAMIVCALAVTVPSDVTGKATVTGEVATVSSVDEFNEVMSGIGTDDYANVTTIQISGTLGSATDYVVLTVDKAVTITSAGTTAATVYGTFNVTVDGVTIDGNDVVQIVDVPFDVAVLGGKVPVRLVNGKTINLNVPSDTSSGKRLTVRGAGFDGGDDVIVVNVTIPHKTTDRLKEALRRLEGDIYAQ